MDSLALGAVAGALPALSLGDFQPMRFATLSGALTHRLFMLLVTDIDSWTWKVKHILTPLIHHLRLALPVTPISFRLYLCDSHRGLSDASAQLHHHSPEGFLTEEWRLLCVRPSLPASHWRMRSPRVFPHRLLGPPTLFSVLLGFEHQLTITSSLNRATHPKGSCRQGLILLPSQIM